MSDIPAAGTMVTAVPLGLELSKANNLLEYPDPSIPDMTGAPDTVTGLLVIVPVDVSLGRVHIQYTRYEVDGWDVDPKTIVGHGPATFGDQWQVFDSNRSGAGHSGGTMHTGNIKKAAAALAAGKSVELKQPRQLSTLIDKLGKEAKNAQKKGKTAPAMNLANVSVKGTNLFFHGGSTPRIAMPQLKGDNPTPGSAADKLPRDAQGKVDLAPGFRDYLAGKGYTSTNGTEDPRYLRATQSEIDGSKVARMMDNPAKLNDPTPLFVSSDNYIVDGHHHFAARVGAEFASGRSIDMPVTRVDAPISRLLPLAQAYTKAMGMPSLASGE